VQSVARISLPGWIHTNIINSRWILHPGFGRLISLNCHQYSRHSAAAADAQKTQKSLLVDVIRRNAHDAYGAAGQRTAACGPGCFSGGDVDYSCISRIKQTSGKIKFVNK
jgi:hypothetical protein